MNEQDIQTVLWDVSPGSIGTLSAEFVIRRALSYGGIFLIGRVIHKYGREGVKKEFEKMLPTSISERKYFYLKHFFLV